MMHAPIAAGPMAVAGYRCAATGETCDTGDVVALTDRTGAMPDVGVARCRACGIGITVPPLRDVAFLYAERESQDFQPDTGGWARRIKRVAFGFQARDLLRWIGGAPARIVDMGCGSGLLTRRLGDLATAEVIGVDYHDTPPLELADRAYRGMARSGDLVGTADAVIAMHVLEHGEDIDALLRRIAGFARPGGTVLIEVPHVDCVWAPLFGRHWDAWYVPYHRVHFSRRALVAAVAAAGLEVERVGGVCVPGLGRSLANALGRRNGAMFVALTAALQPLQWLVETLTRRPSGLRVRARVPAASPASR